MSDDLDELDAALRRAMAALDGEAPAGYFDALPGRTLARLDDPAIDELPDEPGRPRPVQVRAPVVEVPDDDGGDDDDDDDDGDGPVYASQIMSVVGLRELADPTEPEAAASAGPAAAEPPAAHPASAASVPPRAAATGPVEAPGGAVVPISAGPRRRSRLAGAAVGIGAIGVAAVAAIYLAAGHQGRPMEPRATSAGERSAAVTPDAAGSAASLGAGSAAIAPPESGSAAQGSGSAAVPPAPGKPSVLQVPRPGEGKLPTKGSRSRLDAELPEGLAKRGVGKKRKADPPRSDRTALSGDDIERAMTAVAGQARACFAGTRGTAALHVTVAPSGRITRLAVTGAFAGTPTGACIVRAVQAATFPVWDGPVQSFDYSYLLSD